MRDKNDDKVSVNKGFTAYSFEPIGIISTRFRNKYDAPHQIRAEGKGQKDKGNQSHSSLDIGHSSGDNTPRQMTNDQEPSNQAILTLLPHQNYEQALADIQGFERVWLVYIFHENVRNGKPHWKPKVLPPRGRIKRGVFATRAPYRPNPLGISVVRLLDVQGLMLRVGDCDLLDGTPILDIKPYIPLYDSFPDSRTGWLEEIDTEPFTCDYTPEALQELNSALKEHPTLDETLRRVLSLDPFPHPYRRIRQCDGKENCYEYAYQTWRISYIVQTETKQVLITSLFNAVK
ncbi:MAG: tRNA (N6-threonylcarbamoyladenosine(37)-N6)-methyltransferase TrmO [Candidatus Kapabacteria bacterium]|jgi:tRNA-Thr(GGU) m(6)t(6)A37 methyltransferase TsaA|nr:tRNA (N6-threonylcarbamoyladenosine(37)-N6)-methyltransferase TrmO [Candidatus Kapabacteria bacterium]